MTQIAKSFFQHVTQNFSHLIAGLDEPEGGLGGQMSCHHDVGLPASDLLVLAGANDHGVGGNGDKLVNVGSKVNLDHVAVLENHIGVVGQRREVANAVVHGDATREGNA